MYIKQGDNCISGQQKIEYFIHSVVDLLRSSSKFIQSWIWWKLKFSTKRKKMYDGSVLRSFILMVPECCRRLVQKEIHMMHFPSEYLLNLCAECFRNCSSRPAVPLGGYLSDNSNFFLLHMALGWQNMLKCSLIIMWFRKKTQKQMTRFGWCTSFDLKYKSF
jgi:hypothetical protein